MAVYEVFSYPVHIRYKTSVCSKTTCFYVVSILITTLCPFFITFYSQGFWRKVDFYREQPDISFKHKMLLVLETRLPNQMIFWSTYEKLNEKVSQEFQQILPTVEHREEDYDTDGKSDELKMTIKVPLLNQEVISVKVVLVFDYKLYLHSEFVMECAVYVHHDSAIPGASFSTFGELSLTQKEPLKHTGSDERYNIPVIDPSDTKRPVTKLENILLNYMRRNITTVFQNNYPIWEAGRAENETFTIDLVILYPEENIQYRVGFWQLLKWALVQYMTVFIIFVYIIQRVQLYLLERRILPSIKVHPLKEKV